MSSPAYKSKSAKDEEMRKSQMPVHNPFVKEKPRRSYKVGRVQDSSDSSFISWFAIFRRLFYHWNTKYNYADGYICSSP